MSEHPPQAPPSRADLVAATLTAWQHELADLGGPNTLLWYRDGDLSLDLTRAHPGGVARFLAGGRTRLSDLFREPSAFEDASRHAWAIRRHAARLRDEHGLTCAFLAIGLATWTPPKGQHQACAPVLLREVRLTPVGQASASTSDDSSGDTTLGDLALDLGHHVELNPVLVSYLRQGRNITLDAAAIEALAADDKVVNPYPAYAELARRCEGVPGFEISQRQVIATFPSSKMTHVADLAENRSALEGNDIVAAMAGVPDTLVAAGSRMPTWRDNADLGSELLAVDADSTQQAVVDAARAGASFAVIAPPATGATQAVAAMLAALAADGRSTLLVCEDQREIADVVDRLRTVGLDDLVLALPDGGTDRARVVRELALTLERRRNDRADAKRAAAPARTTVVARVTELRQRLLDHAATMHQRREPWGVSAYEVQSTVAALSQREPAPASRVRLRAQTLAETSQADLSRVIAEITEAAQTGNWSTGEPDPWFGARITSPDEVARAQAIVDRLGGTSGDGGAAGSPDPLAQTAELVAPILADAGMPDHGTVGHWRRAVETLVGVQHTLEVFRPDVFSTDLRDHIFAADDESDLGWTVRSRIRRETRTLLRPGPTPTDLAKALRAAAAQREAWRDLVGAGARPHVSPRAEEAAAALEAVIPDLAWLTDRLAGTPAAPDLFALPLDDLRGTLRALAARPDRLAVLPEVVRTLDAMDRAGFAELMADLAARGVAPGAIADEVELVWWTSLSQHLADQDRSYGGHDGRELHDTLTAYRELDRAHLACGPQQVRVAAAEHALRADRRVIDALSRSVAAPPPVRDLVEAGGPGVLSIAPVWAMSPLVVPQVLPCGPWFDTLVVLRADATTPARVAAGLARTRSVILVGDDLAPAPSLFAVGTLAVEGSKEPVGSLFAALPQLPRRALGVGHGLVDPRLAEFVAKEHGVRPPASFAYPAPQGPHPVRFEHVEGGAQVPAGPDAVIESTDAEVARVVDLVRAHIATHPNRTLGVVALTAWHAARVDAALVAAGLVDVEPGGAPVAVAGADTATIHPHDVVLLSVGYGKTLHGRVIYRFPALALEGGERLITAAMGSARRGLIVVSTLRADDLDDTRLTSAGAQVLKRMLAYAETGRVDGGTEVERGETADPLMHEFAERLRREGLHADECGPSTGGRVSLVVTDPDRGAGRPVAVIEDSPAYGQVRSVRDRDRLFPEALERDGWRAVPVWSTDLFRDPARDVARVLAAVRGSSVEHESAHREADPPPTAPHRDASAPAGAQDPPGADEVADEPAWFRRRRRRAVRPPTFADLDHEPGSSVDDTDLGWGERPQGSGHDQWLREQRPPHWE